MSANLKNKIKNAKANIAVIGLGYVGLPLAVNFAKVGFECRHNLDFWGAKLYIGIGAGAHSYFGGKTYHNIANIKRYIEGSQPIYEEETDKTVTELVMGLRILKGLEEEKYAVRFIKEFESLIAEGMLVRVENRIRLTNKGLDMADYVTRRLI